MEKRWIYRPEPDEAVVDALSKSININQTLASILVQRGVNNYEEAQHFFRPSLKDLHDPFLMKDMREAVNRISDAIAHNEKILIYGDYDVDGTTAVSLVYGFLNNFYKNLEFYIPDRYTEGYGISEKGIRYAHEAKVGLIIALDCGIKAIQKIRLASDLGMDVIICDHHLPGEHIPEAHAVLDPKRKDCPYPFKELSGCGIGFKLMQAFCLQQTIALNSLYNYLDLVAVSIASDIVPIVGENRILAHFGLRKLNKKPLPGLRAIIKNSGYKGDIDISGVVFSIGPRINATGRISHAKASVELLLSDNIDEARKFAVDVEDRNVERKGFDTSTTEEALALIESDEKLKSAKSTVLFKEDWHKGVIGIVASRCVEKYYRPTIILTQSANKATGSARSVVGFNVYKAIEACADLLEQFGGHQYAAGLTLSLDKVGAFQERFEEVVAKQIKPEQLIPQIEIDQTIALDQINFKFFNILKQMAPFGPQNMQPVFCSQRVKVVNPPRILKDQHLKMYIKQEDGKQSQEAIGFGMATYFDMIAAGMPFSVAYTIEENNYMDRVSLQLNVKDIKFD